MDVPDAGGARPEIRNWAPPGPEEVWSSPGMAPVGPSRKRCAGPHTCRAKEQFTHASSSFLSPPDVPLSPHPSPAPPLASSVSFPHPALISFAFGWLPTNFPPPPQLQDTLPTFWPVANKGVRCQP